MPTRYNKKISQGIRKLVKQFKRIGKIKTSRATYKPQSLKKAIKIAAAIEYGRYRKRGR
ncbi:MAG: hypothetical protein QW469_00530 [Candidatus Aenigmatarchaeota archaeon]